MPIPGFNPGLQFYVDKLNEGEPFAFVRYGNGEWDCVFASKKVTGSGSQRLDIPALQQAMVDSLLDKMGPDYFMALQSRGYLERVRLLGKIEDWFHRRRLPIVWHNGEVFAKASFRGQFHPMVKVLKKRPVVVVGPAWLQGLPFTISKHVVTENNCWAKVDTLFAQLRATPPGTVVSFSAGPTTKVLIHRLFPLIGDTCWLIDFGSLWDIYVGRITRTYHRRLTDEIIRHNLTGR